MSAFAGIVNLDGQPVESAWIETMLDRLAHRGTDGRRVWVAGSAGLGHIARWTTPEATLESLPMEVGGRTVITGDVRLDNRGELLRALPDCSFLSPSAPDCALVLAAYEKWGEDCVEHLLGDFAFAIWDKNARKLFCGRDHMGIKPFYYAVIPNRRLVFGTEIKAVLSVPGISDAVNAQSVADHFVHLIDDPALTFYAQVSRLPAAHSLSLKSAVSVRRYWRMNPERELRLKSDQEYAEQFRSLFTQAVQCRARSSHPVGAMLSGGLDSSSVTCVARDWLKAQGKPKLHTFSAVFDEVSECDERPYIQTVLDQGHCEPYFMVADRLSPLGDAESVVWHLDQPLSGGNLYVNRNMHQKANELGVRVVLDGFDGDSTVSHGMGRLTELAGAGRWRELAVALRTSATNLNTDSWVRCWWSWYCRYHPAAKRVNRLCCGVMRRLRRPGAPSAPAWDPISFLNPDLARSFGFREIARNPPPPHRNERERHVRLLERELMVKIVEVLDHTSAAFNVEVRFPFMDVRLIEYCVSLPSDQKFRGATTRYVMHAGMAGVLPDKIQQRGDKSDLGPSFEKGLFKFERETLGKKILQEADQLAPYLNLGLVKQCLDRYQNGTASETDFLTIWRAIGVALWLRSRRTDTGQFIQRRKEVK